jgi:uncharacterized membrane protein
MLRLMKPRLLISCLLAVAALGACSPVKRETTEKGDVLPPTRGKGQIVLGGVDMNAPLNVISVQSFWGLEIRPGGMRMAGLDRPELFAPNPGPVLMGAKAVWETTADVGTPLKVEIVARPCTDGLSSRAYPLTAKINFAGDVMNGCAGPRQFVVESSWRSR